MTDKEKWKSIQKEYGSPKNGIEQISILEEFNYEVDYITDLMNVLEKVENQ